MGPLSRTGQSLRRLNLRSLQESLPEVPREKSLSSSVSFASFARPATLDTSESASVETPRYPQVDTSKHPSFAAFAKVADEHPRVDTYESPPVELDPVAEGVRQARKAQKAQRRDERKKQKEKQKEKTKDKDRFIYDYGRLGH